MSKSITFQEFIARAKKTHGDKYDYSEVVIPEKRQRGIYTREVKIICKIHGQFIQSRHKHITGSGCRKCGIIQRGIDKSNRTIVDREEFIDHCNKIHNNKYDYSKLAVVKTYQEIIIICPIHGEFKKIASHHSSGQGCLKCSYEARGKNRHLTRKEFIERSNKVHNSKYSYNIVPEFVNEDLVPITCTTHGIFRQNSYKHMSGQRCPSCAYSGISKAEKELCNFIRAHYNYEILENDRKIIAPRELDIVLPDLNLAFEFNGVYWHANDDSNCHAYKTKSCKAVGYRLIHIFEDDWYYKTTIIKSFIKYLICADNRPRISARNCVISDIPQKLAKEFLIKYHIQGSDFGNSFRLALTYDDYIVAVLTLRKDKDDLLITRYATSCNVRGGFSKLLKAVKLRFNPVSLTTFADLTISEGDLYEMSGFKIDYEIPPDYKYVVNGIREHKFKWRHTSGLPTLSTYNKEFTEFQNMDLAGIPRIYDAGKIKYKMICY